jgi:dienelactone hydrolase
MEQLTFRSHGEACAARHVTALTSGLERAQGRPCVVMARGICGTRDPWLVTHAARFTAEGYDVLLFDYARQHRRSARRERAELRAAIATARTLPGVDPDRIYLWGASRDADHVTRVAAADERVAGAIAMRRADADDVEGAHRALVGAR